MCVCRVLAQVLVLALAARAVPASGAAPAGEPKSVSALFAAINRAWADRNLSAIGQVLHAPMVAVFGGGNAVRVVGREQFVALLTQVDLDKAGLESHVVRVVAVLRQRDLALCGTCTEERRNGQIRRYNGANVLCRTENGWRIVVGFPAFMSCALHIKRVFPGGQGADAGLRKGDCFVSYGGRAVHSHPDIKAAQRAAKGQASADLVVRREGREVTVQVKPGLLGVECEHVLSAGGGATMEGPDADAVRAELQAHIGAARRRDIDTVATRISDKGFVDCAFVDKGTRVLGRQALLDEARKAFASKEASWEHLRATGIRVIVKGPLALARIDVSIGGKAEGADTSASMLCLLVKQPEGWRIVANLPPMVDIRRATPQ